MRPYRRKHHSTWRTRRRKGIIGEIREYLQPFIYCTKALWKTEPPFPLILKVFIIATTWFLLFLPLCYFLVPPLVAFSLFYYFSDGKYVNSMVQCLAGVCTRMSWSRKLTISTRVINSVIVASFIYDYYKILQSFLSE